MASDTDTQQRDVYGEFTVAGIGHEGSDVDEDRLWRTLEQREAELAEAAVSDDRYGVLFDFDQDGQEFTYFVGYEVDSTDDLGSDVGAVTIPEATYAEHTSTAGAVDEVVADPVSEEVTDANEDIPEPIFERYEPGEDPTVRDDPSEVYVPVSTDRDDR
jgi:predicted transcriptional regulator YdeE